jgi:hypothetical protein
MAIATLAYVVHGARRTHQQPALQRQSLPVSATLEQVAPTANARHTQPVLEPLAHGSTSIPTIIAPFDPTALEIAAAQAWLAGHTIEAAQLYQQLSLLLPQNSEFAAAATILLAQIKTTTRELQP